MGERLRPSFMYPRKSYLQYFVVILKMMGKSGNGLSEIPS